MGRIERLRERTTLTIVLGGAALLPLFFVAGVSDRFRLPKELFLRGEAILLAAAAVIALLLGASLPRLRDRVLLLPIAACAVVALLTMASTKPALSASALAAACATLVVYLATVDAGARGSWILIAIPLAAAAVNAIIVILEETNLWMPFGTVPGIAHHMQCTAFVGNPNEIGGYLGGATLACIAMLFAGGTRRWPAIAAAVILGGGLVASRTLTAMIALGVASIAMLALSSRRTAFRGIIVAAIVAALLIALVAPLRMRALTMASSVRRGNYNALVTDRLTPFAAAWLMFTDHPLTGVGPGAFAWHYYDYKLRAEIAYPHLRRAFNRGTNYGEAHNDHLQTLAEGGVVGYGTFAALLAALASLSFAIPAGATDERRRFVRQMALPLAVYWIVLSLAQFPLETTVVRSLLVHFAAVCAAWSRP